MVSVDMAEESVDIIVLVVSVDIMVAVSVLISVDSVVVSAGLESQAEKATVPRTMADITNNFFMVIMGLGWGLKLKSGTLYIMP